MNLLLLLLALYSDLSVPRVLPETPEEVVNSTLEIRAHVKYDCSAQQTQQITLALRGVALALQCSTRALIYPRDDYDRQMFIDRFGSSSTAREVSSKRTKALNIYLAIFYEAQRTPYGRTEISCVDPNGWCDYTDYLRAYTHPETNSIHLVSLFLSLT